MLLIPLYRSSAALVAALAALAIPSLACGFSGPDLFVCRIGGTSPTSGFANHGPVGGIRAYAVDSLACNLGDAPITWDDDDGSPTSNNHPVVSTTMFRLLDGQFIQVGQSWVKHAGNAVQASDCDSECQPGGNGSLLGIGCCDAYRAVINGNQALLGPKSEVNPATGAFPYPFCDQVNCPPASATSIQRRLQVKESELDLSASVQYFIQVHYIVPDDINVAFPPTHLNNVSYRAVNVGSNLSIASWAGSTVGGEPAIFAWRDNGLGPGVPDASVTEAIVDVPGDGRFIFAGRARDLGGGQWRYEYAVQNLNSDRAGQAFTVPLSLGLAVSNVSFHDVDSHSGEVYSNTDWAVTGMPAGITWATQPFAENANANALRWDTLYNFGFQTARSPKLGQVSLALFKPGSPAAIQAILPVPDSDCNNNGIGDATDIAQGTSPDINGNGVPDECEDACPGDIVPPIGVVDVDDLVAVILAWGNCPMPTNCPADVAPPLGDGVVDVDDLVQVILSWGACK
jgi:hypothetical protein